MLMENPLYYCQHLSASTTNCELKTFKPLYDEVALAKYLKKIAKIHEKDNLNRTYIVRSSVSDIFVGWFGLKVSSLPYQYEKESFLIPAIELTHFAIDERYKKNHKKDEVDITIGEYIFRKLILPIVISVSEQAGCKDLYIFAINKEKLIRYYSERLGFKQLKKIDAEKFMISAVPEYDRDCIFMYQPI
jgi:hypothetical protein